MVSGLASGIDAAAHRAALLERGVTEHHRRSWNLGVNAYVVKPVDINQFFEAVKTLGKFWAVFNQHPQHD